MAQFKARVIQLPANFCVVASDTSARVPASFVTSLLTHTKWKSWRQNRLNCGPLAAQQMSHLIVTWLVNQWRKMRSNFISCRPSDSTGRSSGGRDASKEPDPPPEKVLHSKNGVGGFTLLSRKFFEPSQIWEYEVINWSEFDLKAILRYVLFQDTDEFSPIQVSIRLTVNQFQ